MKMNPFTIAAASLVAALVMAGGCCSRKAELPETPASNQSAARPAAGEDRQQTTQMLESQIAGTTFVAQRQINNVDQIRSFGIANGFGNNEPICDFVATEKFTSKNGKTIQPGDSFKIGIAKVVTCPDGYGNTGTKLIFQSEPPNEGLVFYAYGFNANEKLFWAIGRKQTQIALQGSFLIR